MEIINYKIKVGIEEFLVTESDIPRITVAMQSNEMVRLDCGIFRGQAILAIIKNKVLVSPPRELTNEEKLNNLKLEARKNCYLCNGIGSVIYPKERIVKICKCQNIKLEQLSTV